MGVVSHQAGFTRNDVSTAFDSLFRGSSFGTSGAGKLKHWHAFSRIMNALLPAFHWYVGRFVRFVDEAAARIRQLTLSRFDGWSRFQNFG